MKIVVIHEVNYLTKVIYEYQIIPEILASFGHEVVVIDYDETWRTSNGGGRVWDLRTKVHEGVSRAYLKGRVTVRRPGMIRLPLLSRVSGAAMNAIEVHRELSRSPAGAVLLYGVPTVGVQALLNAHFHNVPVFFRAIDVSHELARNPALSRITRLLERIVYNKADRVIALTPRLKDYVRSYGVAESKIRVLPVGVDREMFQEGPLVRNPLHKWGIQDGDFVALFMGTIYGFSGLDRVISDLPPLLSRQPNVKLLIVGHGEDEDRLKKLSREKAIERNVIFTGLQPYASLPDIIRASDVCINPFELNATTRDILPTKIFQYLACGRPVLATKLPGMLPFLSGEQHGIVYVELPDFVRELERLQADRARSQLLGQAGAEAMKKNYDWVRIAEQFLDCIAELS